MHQRNGTTVSSSWGRDDITIIALGSVLHKIRQARTTLYAILIYLLLDRVSSWLGLKIARMIRLKYRAFLAFAAWSHVLRTKHLAANCTASRCLRAFNTRQLHRVSSKLLHTYTGSKHLSSRHRYALSKIVYDLIPIKAF
jgi:hypothetical protein